MTSSSDLWVDTLRRKRAAMDSLFTLRLFLYWNGLTWPEYAAELWDEASEGNDVY